MYFCARAPFTLHTDTHTGMCMLHALPPTHTSMREARGRKGGQRCNIDGGVLALNMNTSIIPDDMENKREGEKMRQHKKPQMLFLVL